MLWSKWRIVFLLTFISIFNFSESFSQNVFDIENEKGEYRQKFELVNGLVIIPVEVNGRELSFLLDTGVDSTILFSFAEEDSIQLKNPSVIYLKGLGEGEPLRALKSTHNTIKMGDVIGRNQSIYILEGGVLNISNRLGVAINGIIGYEFFKDFVVKFNYDREVMDIYQNWRYDYKKCKRCVELPLSFYKNKPYISVEIELENSAPQMVNMLLDSGSGDAVWLLENPEKNINIPNESFNDFLGFGISGSVYGQRSRINKLSVGKFDLNQVTVSFPDSLYTQNTETDEYRDGSIGSQVLERFHSIFDYSRRKLILKPNRNFRKAFEYNMSGVVLEHSGYNIVKSENINSIPFELESDNGDALTLYQSKRQVEYVLEASYSVAEIRPGSPAEIAGLKVGDEILRLNRRPVYKYNLQKLAQIFSSKEGKRIKLEIMRGEIFMEIEFKLKRIL
ncbi:aspartyl protease family protein [Christiangramia salexigens]|uniref:PDZ domain-containing protein n=1 Tax=Christiangramia salexigens TaxID=1913577 RepID=A0A1L3J858_9FLAO|nr:aspartyl protease family protein [Christiangramia salexigens]APG61283.1 hypothetical protein LPB144_13085 [Christiangramia salexigens]